MIIDIHAHVYLNPLIKGPGARTPFLSAVQQIAVMDAKGVDNAVILPLVNSVPGSEPQSIGEILQICRNYPGRFIPFCNIDPRIGKRNAQINVDDFRYVLEQYRDLGCRGLGEVTARIPFDDPAVLALFQACDEVGFPVTFHTTAPTIDSYGLVDDIGLPRFERVLKMFPNLKFFGHSQSFWAEIGGDLTLEEKGGYPPGPVKPGGRLPYLFRTYPNLYGDISAGSGLNALRRDPDFGPAFIEEFQDRLLLGLDYCSTTNNMQHIEWLRQQNAEGKVSTTALDKILGQNACRLLALE
ncbi:MAG: amidohydrolase family protein [Lentisphaerae bacterium]|jgi:predicted TIM-barrel fold metal-dependent hydrolase|nr:amidohydrolase family protein [Lentisphaerota bacterium]